MDPLNYRFYDISPRKGDIRRMKIIDAALESISSKGITRTTFASLAKQLKINRSHVTYYFGDMEDLVIAVTKHVLVVGQIETIEYIKETTDPLELLLKLMEAPFAWLSKHPRHMTALNLALYYGAFNTKLNLLGESFRAGGRGRLAAAIAKFPNPKRRSPAVLDALARTLHCSLAGIVSECCSCPRSSEEVDRYKRLAVQLALTQLGAAGLIRSRR